MPDQKTETAEPKAAAHRRNTSRPAARMREDADRRARDAAAEKVAKLWVDLCQGEPLMVELLLPEELRRALGELARVTTS